MDDSTITSLLRLFDVSPITGFLPSTDPLPSLLPASPKFASWEHHISRLSSYLHSGTWRWIVDNEFELIQVESGDLEKEEEQKRALLIFGMFANAYVFSERNVNPTTGEPMPSPTTGYATTTSTNASVVDFLPPSIALPFLCISSRLGMVPILTQSSITNYNYYRISPSGPLTLGNLACLHQFYGGIDEANFYLLTVEIEAVGGKAVGEMIRASHYVRTDQKEKLIRVLQRIKDVLVEVNRSMGKMSDSVDPYVFFTRIRPYISGWKGNTALPKGIQYRTRINNTSNSNSTDDQYRQYSGGSAAQSALIAAFDMFFGVAHTSENTRQYMSEMRHYMPAKHRDFLSFIEHSTQLKQFVHRVKVQSDAHSCGSGSEEESEESRVARELATIYNGCVDELVTFRNLHLAMVQTYILAQAYAKNKKNKPAAPAAGSSTSTTGCPLQFEMSGTMKGRGCSYNVDASQISVKVKGEETRAPNVALPNEGDDKKQSGSSSSEPTTTSERGTGGTSILPFLRTSREETRQVKVQLN